MTKEEKAAVAAIAGTFSTACAVLVFVPVMLLRGYVLHAMWGWFVVPLGVPAVGIVHAIGIAGVAGALVPNHRGDDSPSWRQLAVGMVNMLLTWGIAAIVHLFM